VPLTEWLWMAPLRAFVHSTTVRHTDSTLPPSVTPRRFHRARRHRCRVRQHGTLSLKVALEQLGLGSCYHAIEIMRRVDHIPAGRLSPRATLTGTASSSVTARPSTGRRCGSGGSWSRPTRTPRSCSRCGIRNGGTPASATRSWPSLAPATHHRSSPTWTCRPPMSRVSGD
jgi:hypothetical protein